MDLQIFKNEMFKVSIQLEDGEILFDAENVARCLGFTQIKNNKEYIRWATVNRYIGKYVSQEVGKGDFVPEPLVYKLAFKANNEVAEKFQDWLAMEVIPQIRKHGMYAKEGVSQMVGVGLENIISISASEYEKNTEDED